MRKSPSCRRRHLLGLGAVLALGACQLPGRGVPPREFRLTAKSTFDEGLPDVTWALAIDRPTVDRAFDTNRIALMRGLEVEFYADALWVDRPAAMVQPLIVQSFRNSGAIEVVADRRADLRPDFMLQTDITAFHAAPADPGPPEARVALDAKLLTMPRREVVGTRAIAYSVPAGGNDLGSIAMAFDEALGKTLKRLVEWTLATGEANRPRRR